MLAKPHLCYIADSHRHIVAVAYNHILNLGDVRYLTRRSNQVLLAILFYITGSHVGIVFGQRSHQVIEGEAVGQQPGWIRGNMKFLLKTPDSVYFRHAWHQAQLRPNHPILQGTQSGRIIGFTVILPGIGLCRYRVVEYFPQTCGNRSHHRFNARWHLTFCLLQSLVDQVASKIDIGAFLKNDSYLRQCIP